MRRVNRTQQYKEARAIALNYAEHEADAKAEAKMRELSELRGGYCATLIHRVSTQLSIREAKRNAR